MGRRDARSHRYAASRSRRPDRPHTFSRSPAPLPAEVARAPLAPFPWRSQKEKRRPQSHQVSGRKQNSAKLYRAQYSFDSFHPAQNPRCTNVHGEALQRKGQKSQISRNRHLENLHALKHRKCVMPFRRRPVIPEFPQPPANEPRSQKTIETPPKSFRKIAEKRWKLEPAIDRIKQQQETEPHERKKVRSNLPRRHQRNNQASRAANHHCSFSAACNFPRLAPHSWQHRLHQVGSLENCWRNRSE